MDCDEASERKTMGDEIFIPMLNRVERGGPLEEVIIELIPEG